jgi:hypothetical protein
MSISVVTLGGSEYFDSIVVRISLWIWVKCRMPLVRGGVFKGIYSAALCRAPLQHVEAAYLAAGESATAHPFSDIYALHLIRQ